MPTGRLVHHAAWQLWWQQHQQQLQLVATGLHKACDMMYNKQPAAQQARQNFTEIYLTNYLLLVVLVLVVAVLVMTQGGGDDDEE